MPRDLLNMRITPFIKARIDLSVISLHIAMWLMSWGPLSVTRERSDNVEGTNLTSTYVCQQSSSPMYYFVVVIDTVQYVFQEEPSFVLYWFDMTFTLHWVHIKLVVRVGCSTYSVIALLVCLHVEWLTTFQSNNWVFCLTPLNFCAS